MKQLALLALPLIVSLVKGRTDLDGRLKNLFNRSSGIRCPACSWRPERDSRWLCDPGCFHSWNTFETRGICPGCDKQWADTACLACGTWSPHDAWYDETARSTR
jgi:hypothetical protein